MLKNPLLYDITPFTLIDYPDHLAAIFWFPGCNMRCGYCYNPHIVKGKALVSWQDALSFLLERKHFLEAVVMSGGECTIHKDIHSLCQVVKCAGLEVKIDTNGSRPEVMRALIEGRVVDFVSLDFKAPAMKYKKVTGSSLYDPFIRTLELLIRSEVPFEVRTTAHSGLLTPGDIMEIKNILRDTGYEGNLYVQQALSHVKYLDETLLENNSFAYREIKDMPGVIWR